MPEPQDDQSAKRVPRWEAERDRLGRETPPVLRWLYGQWWLYVIGVGMGLYGAFDDMRDGRSPVPGLAFAVLLSLPLLALRRSRSRR